MSDYPNPCEKCTAQRCNQVKCIHWKMRYMYRQNQINAYAKKNGIMPEAPEYKAGVNPCAGCRWSENCDSICVARAKWWDESLEQIREVLKNEQIAMA